MGGGRELINKDRRRPEESRPRPEKKPEAEGSSARVSRGSTKTASAEVRSWDAFKRVNVKRATAEEGNRLCNSHEKPRCSSCSIYSPRLRRPTPSARGLCGPIHSRALAGLNQAGLPWVDGIRGRNARRPGSGWLTAMGSCEPTSPRPASPATWTRAGRREPDDE